MARDPDDIERRIREIQAELAAESARRNERSRGPAHEPPRGKSPTRGRARTLIAAVIVLSCMAGAAVGIIRLARHPPKLPAADNSPLTNGPTPSGQPATSTAPSAAFPASPTAAAPFLGTPAQSYANGAAGIVIPLANAAGSYSTAQVAAAYQVTKKMLIAANLNRPTLAGMAPDAFANLLTSQQRATFVSGLDKIGLDASGYGRSTRGWVVSFAPGSTQLVGDVIKVHGTMHAGAAAVDGSPVLRIYVDYLFVYAAEAPDQPSTLMRIVDRADGYVDFATFSDPGGPLEPWWEVSGGGVAGARCDVNDGFVHPDFPGGPPDNVNATGPAVNPYDQSTRPPTGPACHRTSGT